MCWLLSLKYAAPKVYQCAAVRHCLWQLLGAVYFHMFDFCGAVMFATSSSGTGTVLIHRDIRFGLMTAHVPTGKSLCLRSASGKSCHLVSPMPLLKVDPGVSLKLVDLNISSFGAPLVIVDGCPQGHHHGPPCGVSVAYCNSVVSTRVPGKSLTDVDSDDSMTTSINFKSSFSRPERERGPERKRRKSLRVWDHLKR